MKLFLAILLLISSIIVIFFSKLQSDEFFLLSEDRLAKELHLSVDDNILIEAKYHIDNNYAIVVLKYPLKTKKLISEGWKKEKENMYRYRTSNNKLLILTVSEDKRELFLKYQ